MIPLSKIPYTVSHGEVIPHYLSRRDLPWVRLLRDEYLRFSGRPRRELDQRLREPLPAHVPKRESRLLMRLLDRLFGSRLETPVSPAKLRAAVFTEASEQRLCRRREEVFRQVGRNLGLEPSLVPDFLYADIPSERRLEAPGKLPSPVELIDQANLLLAQGLVARSQELWVDVTGGVRAVVRAARLSRLLCTVESQGSHGEVSSLRGGLRTVRLHLSGPMNLLRKTLKYGDALARFLPALAHSPCWSLEARCLLKRHTARFRVSHRDGLLPLNADAGGRVFDSRLEERFYKDFLEKEPEWELLREPEPLEAEGTWVFPDFALYHRHQPSRRVLVEIVGYWTPEYLEKKLRRLRVAHSGGLILCISQALACGEKDLPEGAKVIRYRTRVPVSGVVSAASELLAGGSKTTFDEKR